MILQVICDCYARYLTHFKMKNFGYSIIHFLRNSFGRELVQYYNGMQCLLPSPFSFKDWLASVFGFWTLVGTYMEYWIVLVYLLRQQNGEWRMENGEWMVLVDWCERRGLFWNMLMLFPNMLLALSPFHFSMTFQITTEPFVKKSSIFAYTTVHSHQVTIRFRMTYYEVLWWLHIWSHSC